MKPLNFRSHFKQQMENFVNLRRLSGTDYQSQIKLLEYFDDFLVQKYPYPDADPDADASSHLLTPDMVEGYLHSDSNQRLSKRSLSNRFSVVRQFAHYLSQFDPLSYVPASRPIPKSDTYQSRLPYIYKQTEIKSFLAEAVKLTPLNSLRPHTYYTLFGLLYTTGLRIGEALALNIEDFEQESNLLHIGEGKFRKSRWVPLSVSAGKILQEYIDLRQQKSSLPMPLDSPIFISLKKKRLHQNTVFKTLQFLLKKCGIPKNKYSGPRIHDFRHTFAVHRLIQWYRNGQDVNVRLPALSTYMGHVDISSTQIYLQATAELLEQGNQRFLAHYRQKVKKGERLSLSRRFP